MAFDRFENDYGQDLQIVVLGHSLVGTSSATIEVKRPSGQVMSKSATVDTVANTLTYTWIAGDLDEPGAYKVRGVINQAGKQTRTETGTLAVGGLR